MIEVTALEPRGKTDWLLRGFTAAAALAAVATAGVIGAVAFLPPGGAAIDGLITYQTEAGAWTVDPDGEVVLNAHPAEAIVERAVAEVQLADRFAAPDGEAEVVLQHEAAGSWLYVRDAEGEHAVAQLTDPSTPPLVEGQKSDAWAAGGVPLVVAWSPDSRYLAFGRLTGTPYTLTVVERGTWTQRSHALQDGGYVGELLWSPDGRHLGISTYSLDRRDHTVYVLGVGDAGGAPERLIDGCHITWSPDGEHIALHRDPHREPGVWIVAADGSEAYALTDEPTGFPFAWSEE